MTDKRRRMKVHSTSIVEVEEFLTLALRAIEHRKRDDVIMHIDLAHLFVHVGLDLKDNERVYFNRLLEEFNASTEEVEDVDGSLTAYDYWNRPAGAVKKRVTIDGDTTYEPCRKSTSRSRMERSGN